MRALLTAFAVLVLFIGPAFAEIEVDLELVLAVDASGSVDAEEYRLQLDGLAAALTDPDVLTAVQSGPRGQIAVALIVWAEAGIPGAETAWTVVREPQDLVAFADTIRRFPRTVNGGTGIGAGLAQGMRMMERNGISAPRQVVDVSGDGIETPPRDYVVLIDTARAMAIARGVTINGLAIENEDTTVAAWYRAKVATGPGNFVMRVARFEDFADAMREKLIREITWAPRIGSVE